VPGFFEAVPWSQQGVGEAGGVLDDARILREGRESGGRAPPDMP
jgi:hypothetical protein